jgi:uncharacterized membrane protein
MGRGFSNKQIEEIRSIVNQELEEKKHKGLIRVTSVFYVLLGIGCSILTAVVMPKLIRKGAVKLYKKQLKCRHANTMEEEV